MSTGSPLSLTPREREVAFWVGLGLTNREVAEKLFVTVKTVEYHVANVFTKLGLASRQQLRYALPDAPTASDVDLDGLGPLTRREREVALWAAQGLTNREIADRMFVTVKTVEYHVANVFTKLDLASRQQLRDRVRRPVPSAPVLVP